MKKRRILLSSLLILVFMFAIGVAGASAESDLVPTMTSNTTPSGIASTDSPISDREPFRAFDDSNVGYNTWVATSNDLPHWLSYEFPQKQIVNKYTIMPYYTSKLYYTPTSWTFEGWDDANWINLDQKSNYSNWVAGEKNEFVINNNMAYKKYRIRITETTAASWVAIYEMELYGEPAIQAPTNLVATAGDTQVSLSWVEVIGATSYNIKRSESSGTETTVASSVYANYTDTGLTNDTTYYYVVTAVGAEGESSNSNEVTATPQATLPNAPTGLTATAGDTQVGLSWTEVLGATSYKVKRAETAGGPYTEVVSELTTTSYTDTGLTNGTTYYYVVTALNSSGESANSNEAYAIPQATTTPTGDGTLIVTVANNADREYNLTMEQIQAFIDWYGNRSTGGNVYMIEKTATSPYTRVKDYLIFDKIVAWQIKEY